MEPLTSTTIEETLNKSSVYHFSRALRKNIHQTEISMIPLNLYPRRFKAVPSAEEPVTSDIYKYIC